ncbi:hypothetical protein CCP3SC1AL1_1250001 [Gammaproteobacteria bacterium]
MSRSVGNSFNPRLAISYQPAEHHILKAQFSTAFRPPTFVEMYATTPTLLGNPNLKPETIRTYEVSYIYRTSETVSRATVFHSSLRNLILISGSLYENTSSAANLNGIELELERTLTSHVKLNTNFSYVKTKDLSTGSEIPGSANFLSNVGLVYQPNRDYLLALHDTFVGNRNRDVNDTRNKLGSSNIVSLTGSILNFWQKKGLTMRIGANNLFNSDVRLPAPMNTYPGDYPQAGREWWMSILYDF